MKKTNSFFSRHKKKIALALVGGLAATAAVKERSIAKRNEINRNRNLEERAAIRKPQIDFMFCRHTTQTFNFPLFASMLMTAERSGKPYNTIVQESYGMNKADKAKREKEIAKNMPELIKIAKTLSQMQLTGAFDARSANELLKKASLLLNEGDMHIVQTSLLAFAHGVTRYVYLEGYSDPEIKKLGNLIMFSRAPNAKERYPQHNVISDPVEFIKINAWKLKFRNERMAQTLLQLEKEGAEGKPLRAIVVVGAGHGGMGVKTGVQNKLFGTTKAEIGINADRNGVQEILANPRDLRTLLELESTILAEKSYSEIKNYPKERLLKRAKEFGINYP